MAERRNSLQAVLERQATGAASPAPKAAEPPLEAKRPAKRSRALEETAEGRSASHRRPSREGRKLVAGHFDPKIAKQLKLIAVEEETTVQALLEEALDLLFVKKGKRALARTP